MFKRFVEHNIREALQDTPVVYIMGPRQSISPHYQNMKFWVEHLHS